MTAACMPCQRMQARNALNVLHAQGEGGFLIKAGRSTEIERAQSGSDARADSQSNTGRASDQYDSTYSYVFPRSTNNRCRHAVGTLTIQHLLHATSCAMPSTMQESTSTVMHVLCGCCSDQGNSVMSAMLTVRTRTRKKQRVVMHRPVSTAEPRRRRSEEEVSSEYRGSTEPALPAEPQGSPSCSSVEVPSDCGLPSVGGSCSSQTATQSRYLSSEHDLSLAAATHLHGGLQSSTF